MKILAIEFSSTQRSVAVVEAAPGAPTSVGLERPETTGAPLDAGRPKPNKFGAPGAVSGCAPLTLAEVIANEPPRTAGRRSTWVNGQDAPVMPALSLVEAALVEARLEREQIKCLAIGLGPGSYTGIRGAISLAQGWQLARDVKLLGISSVECLAAQAQADGVTGRLSVVIDAQRGEFYLASFEITGAERRAVRPLRLATLADVQARQQAGELLVGPEVTKWFPAGRPLFPRAATLGQLALHRTDFVPGEKLEPIYLRETTFVKAPPPRKFRE